MPKTERASTFKGRLTIHAARGTVYFHDEHGECLLRIEGLPVPLPDPHKTQLDVRHMKGVAWQTQDPRQSVFCPIHPGCDHRDCSR